ncbi:MAG: phage portal protein family protein [Pyrinomonadaceae bacterium]
MAQPLTLEKQAPATPRAADPNREYVAAQGGYFSMHMGRVLSSLFNDDAEFVAGADVYERMLTDPEISKCVKVIKDGVLGDGVQIVAAQTEDGTPERARADEIKAFCEMCVNNTKRPFRETLDEMIEAALAFGHKVAEQNYRYEAGAGGRVSLVLDSVKVKPRGSTQFVVDEFMNVVGLAVQTIAAGGLVSSALFNSDNLVAREKFFVVAFNRRNEDPRGHSVLRPAYNFWNAKRTGLPIYLKWLEKSAIPSTIGFTSDKEDALVQAYDTAGNPVADANGNPQVQSSAEVMANKLAQLENGSAAAFPHGADVKTNQVAGDGSQFSRFFEVCDSQISMALLLQTLATREGKHQSRAASQTHMDVLALLIWHVKNVVAEAVESDVIKQLVRLNYGEADVWLAPRVALGNADTRDWGTNATAAAALASYLTDSQWLSILAELNIAAPTEGETLPVRAKQSSASPDTQNNPANQQQEAQAA